MPKDLRTFVQQLKDQSELEVVEGADWNLEIGAITEMMSQKRGPALLFDKIRGSPPGYRLITNVVSSRRRAALALGLSPELGNMEIIKTWREKHRRSKPIPPHEVASGPVMENVLSGNEINLKIFPSPKWHELDGGRYIGTGCAVILKDPDEGWLNLGIYRVQVHDERTAGIFVAPGRHGDLIMQKYWAGGVSCPVAISLGHHPSIFMAANAYRPWGSSEYDFAGWVQDEPIDVINREETGIAIPARAEVVIEGEIPPPSIESRSEGPFGEYLGYYASVETLRPVVKVNRILHRNDPIVYGSLTMKPSFVEFSVNAWRAAAIWDELEAAGIPNISGVWNIQAAPHLITVVSIKQSYPGHAKQAATVATGCRAAAQLGRFVIVVDDDIDPSNTEDVLWALGTRCDPESSIDIVRECWSSPLDPRIPAERKLKNDLTSSRAIISACKPYHWIKEFPLTCEADASVRARVRAKYPDLLKAEQ